MIYIQSVKLFCCEDPALIENYDKAIKDNTQSWHCHHRLEIQDGTIITKTQLKKQGLYYKRPACELIFLTKSEHHKLHNAGINNPFYDKHHSQKTKEKLSEKHSKKTLTEEHKKHIGKAVSGKNNGMFGKNHSEEARIKMSQTWKLKTANMTEEERKIKFGHNKGKKFKKENNNEI